MSDLREAAQAGGPFSPQQCVRFLQTTARLGVDDAQARQNIDNAAQRILNALDAEPQPTERPRTTTWNDRQTFLAAEAERAGEKLDRRLEPQPTPSHEERVPKTTYRDRQTFFAAEAELARRLVRLRAALAAEPQPTPSHEERAQAILSVHGIGRYLSTLLMTQDPECIETVNGYLEEAIAEALAAVEYDAFMRAYTVAEETARSFSSQQEGADGDDFQKYEWMEAGALAVVEALRKP